MPADEQGLADCIIAWGRRQIILNNSGSNAKLNSRHITNSFA